MNLKRYSKNPRARAETVDSSVFVAFWADTKLVMALDRAGVEWLLPHEYTLKNIEAGDSTLTRIHRNALVRVDEVERIYSRIAPHTHHPVHLCDVGGRKMSVSRRYKSDFQTEYRGHIEAHGYKSRGVSA